MRHYEYVPQDNRYMLIARDYAQTHSLDLNTPTSAVVVLDGEVVSIGANGSTYHKEHGCERVRLGIPTGQRYDLCEGCSPVNHAESKALQGKGVLNGADVYLWGHWWCCEDCWTTMEQAGVRDVFLVEDAHRLFGKGREA